MQHAVEVIGPHVAASYLKANSGNRKLRPNHVRSLAAAMQRNEWQLTHQGIAFSERGRLLDGQHRLNAIIAANATVQMVVVRGLPDDAFMAVDIGNKRTTADVLSADQKLVEVANLICYIQTTDLRPSPAQVEAWLPRFADDHEFVTSGNKSTARIVSCAGMRLAAVLSINDGQSAEYVKSIYGALLAMDMEALPPVGRSLVAQIASAAFGGKGTGRATSMAALARGMVVFDQAKAELRRVTVKDTATSLAWARSVLRRMEAN